MKPFIFSRVLTLILLMAFLAAVLAACNMAVIMPPSTSTPLPTDEPPFLLTPSAVSLVSTATPAPTPTITATLPPPLPVLHVAYTSGGSRLAAATNDSIYLLDPGLLSLQGVIENVQPLSLSISSDGSMLAAGLTDLGVVLYAANDGAPIHVLEAGGRFRAGPGLVAFSPDGQQIAAISETDARAIQIWWWQNNALLTTLNGHRAPLTALAFSPDGALLASTDMAGELRLWRTGDGKLLVQSAAHSGPIASLAFTPNGEQLATAGEDGLVRLWRIEMTADFLAGALPGHELHTAMPLTQIVISPLCTDTACLLAAAGPQGGSLWDVVGDEHLLELPGEVFAVAFSPGGSTLAAASEGVAFYQINQDQPETFGSLLVRWQPPPKVESGPPGLGESTP
jgi:WD40 repeat protein